MQLLPPCPLQLRHAARQQGTASPAANPLLQPASKRRKQASPKASAVGAGAGHAPSPTASQGAAAAAAAAAAVDEPDPRLCLWEPPVSPYGLLGEWTAAGVGYQQVTAGWAAPKRSQLAAGELACCVGRLPAR